MSAGIAHSEIIPKVMKSPATKGNQYPRCGVRAIVQITGISTSNPIGPLAKNASASETNKISHHQFDVRRSAFGVRRLLVSKIHSYPAHAATVINKTSHMSA